MSIPRIFVICAMAFIGCHDPASFNSLVTEPNANDTGIEVIGTWCYDHDGDSYGDPADCQATESEHFVANGDDCDDSDPAINPVAVESCNELDDNCDGETDEGVTSEFYADEDGDSFGDASEITWACAAPDGFVGDATDCDDAESDSFPGNPEVCDELDNDCDSEIDNDANDATTWYPDLDTDGYGDGMSSGPVTSCEAPTDYVADSTDCDDTNAAVNPDATEICDEIDNNCDGEIDTDAMDTTAWYMDSDGDSFGNSLTEVWACVASTGFVADSTDCDDLLAEVNPDAIEVCNLVDDDCNGSVDGSDATDIATWYRDADSDSFGDNAVSVVSCFALDGYVSDATDCDDAFATVNPAAIEVCDSLDNDCDGATDEDNASDAATWYEDRDMDGYGNGASVLVTCYQPDGYAEYDGDCDDANAWFNPAADESDCADPNDYNCDGSTGYADADADGFAACEECDDRDPAIFPAATEFCNGQDDDCDGVIDDGAIDATTWYFDGDEDSYGSEFYSVFVCEAPMGYIEDATDCDDNDSTAFPGAIEYCDGADNDCDGIVDEDDAADAMIWYSDADFDDYGNATVSVSQCYQPSGFVSDSTDCSDTDSSVHPDATEFCDGADNDCDGAVDDSVDYIEWFGDADGDGYGDDTTVITSCSVMSGWVLVGGDCDETNPDIHPGAEEICEDDLDQDCDGVDEVCPESEPEPAVDEDGDGYSTILDCDDESPEFNPGAEEICGDGNDEDCSGHTDDTDTDADGDGFVDSMCDGGTDCDDSDPSVNPGASELCFDETDQDCGDDEDILDTDCWYLIDADGDGYAGSDCDDTDPVINPAAAEIPYNGIDEDCDGYDLIDVDGDGASHETDCDETDASVHPGAEEVCDDALDNDCDGLDAECVPTDGDSDGWLEADGDCDDADADTFPGASEICYDAADNDCNGLTDDGCPAMDEDADGYSTILDCNDADATVNPGMTEVANGVDDDCDGVVDEDTDVFDDDGDGFSEADLDCDDTDASIHPGAIEYCDGVDNDCDGTVDEAAAFDASLWYFDYDGDGYGDPWAAAFSCEEPEEYVVDATDCDDSSAAAFPGNPEICDDGLDNDCNGDVDLNDSACAVPPDSDGDGYTTSIDCDDTDASVNPGAEEVCEDGLDQDCDGVDAACPVEDTGDTAESTYVGNIACAMNADGVALDVTIVGDVAAGLMMPLPGFSLVGVQAWDSGGSSETAYLGSAVAHTFLIYPASNFTPYASDEVTDEWFDLQVWTTSGNCVVVDDGLGGLVVEYL